MRGGGLIIGLHNPCKEYWLTYNCNEHTIVEHILYIECLLKAMKPRLKKMIILSWLGYHLSKTIQQNTVKKPCMTMINNILRPAPINIWLVEDISFCWRSGLPSLKLPVVSSFRWPFPEGMTK